MSWPKAKLGKLCKLHNGKTYKASEWKTEGLPIIRIQNLKNSAKSFNYWARGFDGQIRVNTGDLLLAWSGTPGTSFGAHIWNGPQGVLNQHIFRVDLDEKIVTKEWALHSINAQLEVLIGGAHGGVGLKHVTKSQVESLEILIPPAHEQKKLVNRLTNAGNLKRLRNQTIVELDSYLCSLFIEMFGDPVTNPKEWNLKPVSEIVPAVGSGWSPVCESRPPTKTECGVLKLGAVTWCNYDEEESKAFLNEHEFDPTIEVHQGDLLFCRKNTYELVAASAYVFSTRPRLMMSDLIFRLNPGDNSGVLPIFLWKLLTNKNQRALIQSLASGSAGSMPNISKERLKKAQLICPPLDLQKHFVEKVIQSQQLKDRLHHSQGEQNTLFSSLLIETFQ